MSVINKMLRDLDARRSEGNVPDLQRSQTPASMLGTSSIAAGGGLSTGRHPRRSRALGLLVLLLAALAVAAWYLSALQPVSPPPQAVVPQPVMAVQPEVQATAPTPEPAASAPASAPDPAESEPTAAVVKETPPPVEPRKKKRSSETTAVPAAPVRERTRKASAPAAVSEPVPVPRSVAAPAPSAPSPAAAPINERRQNAAQEALAQAQTLWNAGSREEGLALVREAVNAVERAQPHDGALLAQLAREQVRMELALGRPATALALLTRLEPVLSGQADLWAVRGNAAQRLGRHAESVQAYRAALQLRPGEQRWMLGMAVSLAALGQLDAAAEQAEQARALGSVSPEVLTYLRQAGVPLR